MTPVLQTSSVTLPSTTPYSSSCGWWESNPLHSRWQRNILPVNYTRAHFYFLQDPYCNSYTVDQLLLPVNTLYKTSRAPRGNRTLVPGLRNQCLTTKRPGHFSLHPA